jgi:fumarylacetoacetate (FAA) hydrolase
LNDWTARDFQRFEMKVNMGPTKGKDFCTTFGSYIIIPDELASRRSGKGYDIECSAEINGQKLTQKNWKHIQHSFEDMLVRASLNCRVLPGEVIASGTMGGGCLMEHNVLEKLEKPDAQPRWLKKGDTVTLHWLPEGPMVSNRIGESL